MHKIQFALFDSKGDEEGDVILELLPNESGVTTAYFQRLEDDDKPFTAFYFGISLQELSNAIEYLKSQQKIV
jgi:hypothetical protein